MTAKEAKEYLSQYQYAAKRVEAIRMHLDDLRAIAAKITPNYSSEGGGSHACSDKLGLAVAKIVDAERETDREVRKLIQTQREIETAINRVPEPYSTLLYGRYINLCTWERLAVQMNYSSKQIRRLHGYALVCIADILEKMSLNVHIEM